DRGLQGESAAARAFILRISQNEGDRLMQDAQAAVQQVNALEAQAFRAAQSGRDAEAESLWGRILEIDPNHARTLTALGQRAFRRGDGESARSAFQRLADAYSADPEQWVNLALA